MNRVAEPEPVGGDWLDVDVSELPVNQLPLLREMIGRRLINIQRSIRDSPDDDQIRRQDFFRKARGPIIFDLEGLAPVYFRDDTYHEHEISIGVSTRPLGLGLEVHGLARRYTLHNSDYVDERLSPVLGQRLLKARILIRKPYLLRDKAQALQDGIQMVFEHGTTIIIGYYLAEMQGRELQILYPEEIPWHVLEYVVDIEKGNISWKYRFNRWKWRALDRLARRIGIQ